MTLFIKFGKPLSSTFTHIIAQNFLTSIFVVRCKSANIKGLETAGCKARLSNALANCEFFVKSHLYSEKVGGNLLFGAFGAISKLKMHHTVLRPSKAKTLNGANGANCHNNISINKKYTTAPYCVYI